MGIFSKAFLRYAGERAVKTLAQAAIAVLTVDQTGVLDVDWVGVASVSTLAAVVSLLTSVISFSGSPSTDSESAR